MFVDYWKDERTQLAYASGGCILLSLVLQALLTFFQYAGRSWSERLSRSILALFSLAPLLEGYNTWTGADSSDLMLSSSVTYASTKAMEIAFESIPESIIQISGLFGASAGEVMTLHVFFVASSILVAAFIMTEGNFGFIQR